MEEGKHVTLKIKRKPENKIWETLKELIKEKCEFSLKGRVRAVEFYKEYLKFISEKSRPLYLGSSEFYDTLKNFFFRIPQPVEFKKQEAGYCISGMKIKGIDEDLKAEHNLQSRQYRERKALEKGRTKIRSYNKSKVDIEDIDMKTLSNDPIDWDPHDIYCENFHEWLLKYQETYMDYDTLSFAKNSLWRARSLNWNSFDHFIYRIVETWVDKHLDILS